MVDVLIIEYQGIVERAELFQLPLDADTRRNNLILENYRSIQDYNEALADSNADYVVHHFTGLKVK